MPTSLKCLRLSIFIVLSAWSLSALAATQNDWVPSGFDDTPKKWEEAAIQLPPPPAAANLMEFYVGPTATQTFFVDEKSMSISGDGVVHYTLVSKSKSGAINVSYEGIRCATVEKKQFAYGRQDGTWDLAHDPAWRPITELVANRQHAALVKDYFCDTNTIAGTLTDIIKRIKYKRPLAPARDYSSGSDNR
ncbi:MAG TPA: CNP1-like family protein [Herbaspirillum sp.]|jgi:hypothetical protein